LQVKLKILSNGHTKWVVCKCTWTKPILLLLFDRTLNAEYRFIISNSCRSMEGSVQCCVSQVIQLLSLLFSRTYFRHGLNRDDSVNSIAIGVGRLQI